MQSDLSGLVKPINEFAGIPPTNKTVEISQIFICRIKDNKIIEFREEADLLGLPESVRSAAADAARAAGMEGKWIFTLHKPSWIPFLQYSEKRELREEIYRAMFMRSNTGKSTFIFPRNSLTSFFPSA